MRTTLALDDELLAATMLTDEARLWSRDRRLRTAAERLGAAYTAETR